MFRPAADVARDLLRLSTPKALRPKRLKKSKHPNASVDLAGIQVLHVRQGALVLALTPSFRIVVAACATDALRAAKAPKAAALNLPFADLETGPALVLRVVDLPRGVCLGSLLDVRARLEVDLLAETPTVWAVATRISLSAVTPRESETRAPLRITLPSIGGMSVTDEAMGLPADPDGIAQERAERFILAALAYQSRKVA